MKINPALTAFAITLILLLSTNCRQSSFSEPGSNTDVAGICRNAYYPIGPNIEREYRLEYVSKDLVGEDYTESYTDFNGDRFIAKKKYVSVSGNGTTSKTWLCTPDGLFESEYGESRDIEIAGLTEKFETLQSRGISIPAEANWKTGKVFTSDYTVKHTVSSDKNMVVADLSEKRTAEIMGEESVTVPAGTFQAFKVVVKTSSEMKIRGRDNTHNKDLVTTMWFANGVGMVKSETSNEGKPVATTELLSYKK